MQEQLICIIIVAIYVLVINILDLEWNVRKNYQELSKKIKCADRTRFSLNRP